MLRFLIPITLVATLAACGSLPNGGQVPAGSEARKSPPVTATGMIAKYGHLRGTHFSPADLDKIEATGVLFRDLLLATIGEKNSTAEQALGEVLAENARYFYGLQSTYLSRCDSGGYSGVLEFWANFPSKDAVKAAEKYLLSTHTLQLQGALPYLISDWWVIDQQARRDQYPQVRVKLAVEVNCVKLSDNVLEDPYRVSFRVIGGGGSSHGSGKDAAAGKRDPAAVGPPGGLPPGVMAP